MGIEEIKEIIYEQDKMIRMLMAENAGLRERVKNLSMSLDIDRTLENAKKANEAEKTNFSPLGSMFGGIHKRMDVPDEEPTNMQG